MSTHTILCGNCGTAVKGPTEPDERDQITCPKCGQSDTYADVLESAKAYVAGEAAKHLRNSIGSVFKGSKSVKFTPGEEPNFKPRWTVADFKL